MGSRILPNDSRPVTVIAVFMCLEVREAAKEGSFHRPVQTSGLAAPDRR
jgi:hypothetical protein